jgi:hypothetical protein
VLHLSHANLVKGGAALFSDRFEPYLDLERFTDERHRSAARLTPGVTHDRGPRGLPRQNANSAEAVRSLKASLGIRPRPTDVPVDTWSRN